MNKKEVLIAEQDGFREGFSTADNIFVLNSLAERALRKKGGKLFVDFIDFEKAFDSVNREAL